MCPQKFWMTYPMGMDDPSGLRAFKGNVVHKALELAARCQMARQRLEPTFTEDETGVTWGAAEFDYDRAVDVSYDHYVARSPHLKWKGRDKDECREWTHRARSWMNGLFDPLNRRVVDAETFFDLELPWEWAREPDGTRLRVKGTTDLLLEVDGQPDALEYCDWKTGRFWDWATNEPKSYDKMRRDAQMGLYYYALRRLFPHVKKLYITVVYVREPGPVTVPFSPSDLGWIEEMLRTTYEAMRAEGVPARANNHACRFCNFAKNDHPESGKTMCEHVNNEIVTLGLNKVVADFQSRGKKEYVGGGRGH
jgi:hypothetical protein